MREAKIKILISILIVGVVLFSGCMEKKLSEDECLKLENEISENIANLDNSCGNDSDCKPLIFGGKWMSTCVNKDSYTLTIEAAVKYFLDKCDYIGVGPPVECSCINNICIPKKEISKDKAISLTKERCTPENPDYAYRYDMIKKVDSEWRIPIMNVNCLCFAIVNTKSEEINCMKCNCTGLFPPFETEKVTITTDKTEYEQGENIEISIENKENCSIYIGIETYGYNSKINIEKEENSSWVSGYYDFSDNIKCRAGGQGPAIGNVEIKAGGLLERIKPSSYSVCMNKSMQKLLLSPGKYRLEINIEKRGSTEDEHATSVSIYSNKFIIRERKVSN